MVNPRVGGSHGDMAQAAAIAVMAQAVQGQPGGSFRGTGDQGAGRPLFAGIMDAEL